MEMSDMQTQKERKERLIYHWDHNNEDDSDQEDSNLVGGQNKDVLSKEQPPIVRVKICGCIPAWWRTENYLTEWELQCYELFKSEIKRYSKYDMDHEESLKRLWKVSFGDTQPPDKLVGPKWKELGFQGEDPRNDFRGGGIIGTISINCLGLYCLTYFVENFKDDFESIKPSDDGLFSTALFCINLSYALQVCFYFHNDDDIMRDYRPYKCNPRRFKNFIRLFSYDSSSSISNSKINFYQLHGHLMITLVVLWNYYLKKGYNQLELFTKCLDETIEICHQIFDEEIRDIGVKNRDLIKQYL
ncbi:unnamed protein product [Moneuplotes crassus]|uniref:ELMO domain-containing protein n=1 Tax=Euplotes crassus TaxID=5936 RepID=A0AAD2CYB2_EUPCR|nr:unnamed protein product [Moneuplotes crassus]